MNSQQYVLVLIAVVLGVLAVPGLMMEGEGPPGTADRVAESAERSEPDDPDLVPETELSVERVDAGRRAEIEYARKVNINEVTLEELTNAGVPNLGQSRAESLIEFRDQLDDPIVCLDQLEGASGIGSTYVEDWQEHFTVGQEYEDEPCPEGDSATSGEEINVNTADESTLTQLTGIGSVTAEAIVAYREENGPFEDLDDLQEVSGIGPVTVEDISGRAVVE